MIGKAELEAIESFSQNTKDHQMTVIKNDGLHRHLRLQKAGTGAYLFDIITWPGYLCFTGDMGTLVFKRLEDMFEFFRDDKSRINPSYWAEKVQAGVTKEYDKDHFEAYVQDRFSSMQEGLSQDDADELWEALQDDVISRNETEYGALEAARDFEFKDFRLTDFWEWDLKSWTFHYIWACLAIVWAIKVFDDLPDAKDEAQL